MDAALPPEGRVEQHRHLQPPGTAVALARYLPNGQRDPSFGEDGQVVTPIGGQEDGAGPGGHVVQPDGKIVVVVTGARDRSFGRGGVVRTRFASRDEFASEYLRDLELQPDGRLVAAGDFSGGSRRSAFLLARYRTR